jgi:hypothetical protein
MNVYLVGLRELFRQTPGGNGIWNNLRFTSDPDIGKSASWLFVFNEPSGTFITHAPLEQRVLFVTEPPLLRKYPPRYTNQFGVAVSPPDLRRFRGRHIRAQPCMNWMFGLDGTLFGKAGQALSYDELSALSFAEKKHTISVVCSTRQGTEQHNRRLAFVKTLKEELGDTLHWFGHGVQSVRDKSEAIVPYRYHVVLENNTIPHFWTEKLADAFLGDCFPIVAGGSQIEDYFSRDSFEYINLNNIDAAVAKVSGLVKQDIWAERYPAIRASRERLLTEHNLFAFCEKYISCNDRSVTASSIRPSKIRPIYSSDYRKFREARKHVRHRLRKAFPYGIF